ncbi:hypothetical protein ANCDUO_11095 [Ancylostoma duodenale]|uniref:Uncharacterized protein n=1 Tax=Ancylostoma duodenale TaxID=51022 RepID=A0A0C2CPL3_9BILA|nr:hypothetical protein ANCDUO_11095 [Ancylostoma duodenale]
MMKKTLLRVKRSRSGALQTRCIFFELSVLLREMMLQSMMRSQISGRMMTISYQNNDRKRKTRKTEADVSQGL